MLETLVINWHKRQRCGNTGKKLARITLATLLMNRHKTLPSIANELFGIQARGLDEVIVVEPHSALAILLVNLHKKSAGKAGNTSAQDTALATPVIN